MSQNDDDQAFPDDASLYAGTRFGMLEESIAIMFAEHPDLLPDIIESERAAIQGRKNPGAVERAKRSLLTRRKGFKAEDMHKLEDPIVPIEDMLDEVDTIE